MTNFKIVMNEAINAGLFTKEEIENFISKNQHPPIFTYQEWQKQGFQVKKGEKAKLTCKIWKPKRTKKEEQNEEDTGEFFLKMSNFFIFEQVEKIEKGVI